MMRQNMLLLILGICLINGLEDRSFNQIQYWFDEQLVDHTDPTSKNITWSQRYWAVENFYVAQKGTIILYICGEYTCPGVNPDRLFVIDLAKRYNALVLVLEHRYYGNSMPFGDESLQLSNLKQLNIHQALDDLAYFLTWIKKNNKFGVTDKNPWMTVGGSYPGAMSAWFRFKYPHLTIGALASSAVVNSQLDYPEFDGQIYTSTQKSSNECTLAIQNLTNYTESFLTNDTSSLKIRQTFKSEFLNNKEFLLMIADVFVEMVQYGKRTYLCDQLKNKTVEQQLNWTAAYVQKEVDVTSYGSYYLKNTTSSVNNTGSGSRQWAYQTCTEVGWLQTAPQNQNKSMRSAQINLDSYRQWCKNSFGADLWPDTNTTNTYFGGSDINVARLIMTNGDEDPWKHVSILSTSKGQLFQAIEIICENCAHCVELYTPTDTDSDTLKKARRQITDSFDGWIAEHWQSIYGVQMVEQ